ncbi:MAG: hypothetical protein Q8R37_01145 [Nanoarchaeota archaeon]|nr:hypothetical protein [Nanoarchaeota archaeon]
MKKRGFVILIGVLLLLLPSALSLSLIGMKLSPIIYEPGKVIVNTYSINGANAKVEVAVGGDLTEYISLSEVINGEFTMTIQFPDTFIDPGTYSFSLSAREIAEDSSGGVTSLIGVSKVFMVEVYSHDKALEASLGAADVNENSTVPFTVQLRSRTYSDIDSVKADIIIYNHTNQSVGRVKTNERALKALQSGELRASFNTTGLPAGDYAAAAVIYFDGKQQPAETQFKIGALDVFLLNYTSVLEQGFRDFVITVANGWGDGLENVYAKVFINGQELLQTPSISLPAWGEGELKGIVKVDLAPGKYPGEIGLFFEGESKQENIVLTVIESPKKEQDIIFYLIVAAVIVIIILVNILFLVLLKKKQDRKLAADIRDNKSKAKRTQDVKEKQKTKRDEL